VAEAAFNKKKVLFTSKFDVSLRKKLGNCYVYGLAFYDAENRAHVK